VETLTRRVLEVRVSQPPQTWRNPVPTVDVLVRRPAAPREVLLIRRSNPPHGWALPGGFVDEGERVGAAALRELLEETGLRGTLETLLHVYSDPTRDPRKHTMSVVFTVLCDDAAVPTGSDDAAEARWFPLDALPSPLCFDHAAILADYAAWLADGTRPHPAR
jgi:8-oxo-dGTP diphosphatase